MDWLSESQVLSQQLLFHNIMNAVYFIHGESLAQLNLQPTGYDYTALYIILFLPNSNLQIIIKYK